MCPTTFGRMETRGFIIAGPALLSVTLWLITGSLAWPELIVIYLGQGWLLDGLLYARVIRWQPPWLTGVLAAGEFVIVYVLAHAWRVQISNIDAVWFYWVSWTIAVSTKIAVLPLLRLTWLEDGGEFRRVRWTVPADRDAAPAASESAPETLVGT